MKPSNMLVNTDGEVKICDFGVSIQVWFIFHPAPNDHSTLGTL